MGDVFIIINGYYKWYVFVSEKMYYNKGFICLIVSINECDFY